MTEPARVAVESAAPSAVSVIEFADVDRFRASPDPREILHVPKPYAV
jgi:hypothetical protein